MMIRYKHIENQVLELLNVIKCSQPDLLCFPLDLVKIIQLFPNYRVWSYQYYAKRFHLPLKDVIVHCQSESGCTFFNPSDNTHLIIFNKKQVSGRQHWTLAHELGHCYLNHLEYVDHEQIAENSIIPSCDKELEMEADFFAATLTSPFPMFKELNITSAKDIQSRFGLSAQAAQNRYKGYLLWQDKHFKCAFDMNIPSLFADFIQMQKMSI